MPLSIVSISGIVTATPTPLDSHGQIDQGAVASLVRHVIDQGASAIAPNGGTGEYTALTDRQRSQMVEYSVAAADGDVPVICGILSPGLNDTISAGRNARALGADALMVVTPYYSRPTQAGIVDYYKAISDAVDAEIMLYEIPYRTGISLTPETVATLAEQTRVVAMKACNNDLSQQLKVLEAAGDKISILSGEENVFPVHVAMGAKGGLLATSCIFQSAWNRIYEAASQNRLADALALHARLMPVVEALFSEHNPAPLKAALSLVGRPYGEVLPPLQPASAMLKEKLAQLVPAFLAGEN
ncbi:4-hydroxy-tetrahydrodipicolinate synthase [Komagataeibacter xylinus]|uniref:4-hydroxy-tetrahydrodipicolinate synthase n=1 Tax=Komagataeibacter xylinus TaxID=28448 RepID=UPI00102FF26D|nr:4-hydroxy-tetrahydrodipicolinate synthase [Komagataeibacter xylinus]